MITTLFLLTLVTAEPYRATRPPQPEPQRPAAYGVFDERGRRTGYVRPDPFVGGRLNIYDEKYRKQGTIEEERR